MSNLRTALAVVSVDRLADVVCGGHSGVGGELKLTGDGSTFHPGTDSDGVVAGAGDA